MPPIPEDALLIYNAHMVFTQQRIEYWLQYTLGSWQWYLLMAMLIVPLPIWWLLVDKRRLLPIVTMGLMVLATANWMDQVGSELGWWHYPHKTIPIFPLMIPVNYSLLPIGYMLIYQWFVPWRRYLLAAAVMSAVMSWICEPLVSWTGIYVLVSWHYSYSFPLYMAIAYTHKRIVDAIIAISGERGFKK